MKPIALVLLLLVVSALLQLAGVDVVTGIAIAVDTTADVLVAVWSIVRERT